MTDTTTPKLKKSLRLRDLILLNVACIVGLGSLAQAAQLGYGAMLFFALAIVTFLIPIGLMVAELNARMPEEGGFYIWTKQAFGNVHGYIAAWSYWLSNIVWYPTIMLLITSSALYLVGEESLHLMNDYRYYGTLSLVILWVVILLNILGMDRAKWISNLGGIATWAAIILLFMVGAYYVLSGQPIRPFAWHLLVPSSDDFALWPFFAAIAFGFGGFELGPVMAEEIENPKVNVPRAIFISSLIVGGLYMVGTMILVMVVPQEDISFIEAIAQAYHQIGSDLGWIWVGPMGSLLVVVGTLGLFGSWIMGTARIPFVVGLDRYLPEFVAKVHPKWGSPYISLLLQGVVVTAMFLASTAGSTIKEAFLVLYDMSVILYFIPFLYMFGALIVHHRRNTGEQGVIHWWGNGKGVWWVAAAGFGVTAFAMILAMIPTTHVEDGAWFVLKVVGGAILLNGLGLLVYWRRKD